MGALGFSYSPHLHLEIVSGTGFTGDWQMFFKDACNHYEDPLDYIQP